MGPFPPEQRERVLAGIDVLVIPSRAPESFSLVAREALLLGKPVVAAAVGALPEVVIDGVNGYLFQPGDIQQLKDILEKISTQPETLSRLQYPGPVPILSVEEHVDKVERIYEDLL
jgi:glycosyltransferase involved in cell wall biosynthesis